MKASKPKSSDYDEGVVQTSNSDIKSNDITENSNSVTNLISKQLCSKHSKRKNKKIIQFINQTKSINASNKLYKHLYRYVDKSNINKIYYPVGINNLSSFLLKDIDMTSIDRLIKDTFTYIVNGCNDDYNVNIMNIISMINDNKIICPIYCYKYSDNNMLNEFINSNSLIKNTINYINKLLMDIKNKYNIVITTINTDEISILDLVDVHNKIVFIKREITLKLLDL